MRCEDCLSLAAAVASGRACGQLRSLNVSCNFLRAEGGKALGACLRHLPGLTELVLNDNSIYYEGDCDGDGRCRPVCEAYGKSESLTDFPSPPTHPPGAMASRGGHLRGFAGGGLPQARDVLPRLQLGGRPREPRDRCVAWIG